MDASTMPEDTNHDRRRFLGVAGAAVMALDVLALKIEKAILAGYDLGSRSADIVEALWPQRCQALVSTTGYLITNPVANLEPAKPSLERAFWYRYYFSTARGEKGLTLYRHDLGELIWKFNSPTWNFSPATYNTTAAAFNNPDYVAVIIDNHRWRLDLVPGDPRYAASRRSWTRLRPSRCPRSPLTASTIPSPRPGTARCTGRISPASTPTGPSTSVTTCRRKRPAPSPRPWSMWIASNRGNHHRGPLPLPHRGSGPRVPRGWCQESQTGPNAGIPR